MVGLVAEGWALSGIEAVLFDKDGTFVDSHHYWGTIIRRRARRLAEHVGGGDDTVAGLERAMGLDRSRGRLLPEGPVGTEPREVVVDRTVAHLAQAGRPLEADVVHGIFTEVHHDLLADLPALVRPIPEALVLIEALHAAGVALAVVTTDTVATTRATLELIGLAGVFGVVVGRESASEEKATGVPARLALEGLGVSAARAVCIGDAPMDALMAARSGCAAAIGVASGQVDAAQLRAYTPHVVNSLADVTLRRAASPK
jgi:phosphoglycolate phosphatase-like HAD superfamily hydrolase